MPWLEKVNHSPCPSQVDSCGVAGLIDLVRCQGVWYKAVKFGFIFGVHRQTLDYKVPSKAEFQQAADIFEKCFAQMTKDVKASDGARKANVLCAACRVRKGAVNSRAVECAIIDRRLVADLDLLAHYG
jgi:hypothetical protein